MMEDPQKSLKELADIESLAEEILVDKAEIVALDARRNETRMGFRALTKTKKKKAWVAVGPLLIRMSTEKAKDLLQKDQLKSDTQVNKLRSNLKVKVNKLRDLEYQDPVPGFDLRALDKEEFSAVGQALGRRST
ncbi:pdrg1 prefoldin-like subunit isoform X2 [Rhodnius prolixus]|uniref:pdrg1 prefoldin-like subunit isoform X2 n=1 Tax=Rhodnius prolixus TaxID=13249 RepID=UPI003D18F6FA